MMTRTLGRVSVGLSLAVAGCSSMQVYGPSKDDPNTTGLIDGVPFYSRVPVLTQETKLLKAELLVSIDVTEINASKDVTRSSHYPPSGALVISPGDRGKVDEVIAALYKKSTGDGYEAVQLNVVAAMADLSKIPPKDMKEEVASNTWSIAMVVSPRPYFINTRQPLIGTASSTYKLNADGTLGEATAAVTDDTAKTLLSLFPIAAKISQDWGVPAPASLLVDEVGKLQCKVEVSITERDTVYTLRKVTELDKSATIAAAIKYDPATPLTLPAAMAGTGGVQLVSKEIASGDDKAKPDTTSYKIQGTFTPPKPPDAK